MTTLIIFGIQIPFLVIIVLLMFVIFKNYKHYNVIKYYAKFTLYLASVTIVPIIMFPYFLLHPKSVLNFL
jgi:hypothetical protein